VENCIYGGRIYSLDSASDDECPRYRFSFLLCSTSRLALYSLSPLRSHGTVCFFFSCVFSREKNAIFDTILFLFFFFICACFFGWESGLPFFSFSFRIHSYSAVSLSLYRQSLVRVTERAHRQMF